jgi:group II intron reverse transcriptase/maturase
MLERLFDFKNLKNAFQRVEASQGMPGVDGVSIREFRAGLEMNLRLLIYEIESGIYRPLPLLKFLVAKKDGSPRPLAVPAVRDRVVQAGALNLIEPILEKEFEDVSFAYRKGRSVKHAALRIKALRDQGFRFVVEVDLVGYFDNIDHALLEDKLRKYVPDQRLLKLIMLWVHNEIYDGEKIYSPQKGIPQGAVISPALANLFLDDFDEEIIRRGFQLVRYSDDFVILAKTSAEAQNALELTDTVMALHHLSLDEKDTGITHFEKGFKFLGLTFMGDSILVPFDRPAQPRQVLYMPPPLDLERYLSDRPQPTPSQRRP